MFPDLQVRSYYISSTESLSAAKVTLYITFWTLDKGGMLENEINKLSNSPNGNDSFYVFLMIYPATRSQSLVSVHCHGEKGGGFCFSQKKFSVNSTQKGRKAFKSKSVKIIKPRTSATEFPSACVKSDLWHQNGGLSLRNATKLLQQILVPSALTSERFISCSVGHSRQDIL